jgi:hypothetical protein
MVMSVRLLLMSALVVLMTVAIVASTAVALPVEGPFWQVNNTKLSAGMTKAVEGKIVPGTVGVLFSKVGGKSIEIVCKKFAPTFSIFNGTQHGESLGKAVFEECIVRENGVAIKECEVNPGATPKNSIITEEVKNSLWYHATNLNKPRQHCSKYSSCQKPEKYLLV